MHDVDLAIPEPGQAVPVAPGVLWARIPLPFKLDHVNVWLLEDGAEWTVVDTGLADDTARECWAALLAGVLDGRPVTRVILTHFHPDHVGCAPWLARSTGAWISMTRPEWLTSRLLAADSGPEMTETIAQFYAAAGCGAEHLAYVRAGRSSYADLVEPLPRRHRDLGEGQEIDIGARRWRIVVGAGHSPAHACLWCEADGLLIAGDQILPRISPNVGVDASAPGADPLADFLSALDRFEAWPGDPLVLPAHDEPFRGLQARARALRRHHAERLTATRQACRRPSSVQEVARVLFDRPLDPHQTGFAIGETLAHLNRLHAEGSLEAFTDRSGVWRFQAPDCA